MPGRSKYGAEGQHYFTVGCTDQTQVVRPVGQVLLTPLQPSHQSLCPPNTFKIVVISTFHLNFEIDNSNASQKMQSQHLGCMTCKFDLQSETRSQNSKKGKLLFVLAFQTTCY